MPCMSIIQASYQRTEILRGGDHALPLGSGGADGKGLGDDRSDLSLH